MLCGWDVPERRFSSPQHIFSILISTRKCKNTSATLLLVVSVCVMCMPAHRILILIFFFLIVQKGEKNQKLYASIEPLGLDGERDQLSTSSNGSIMSATTGECFTNFTGYQSNLMDAFVCSMSDQTLLKSDGNISNISSENDHSSIVSNNSVIEDNSWMQDDSDFSSADTQKDMLLSAANSDDDYEKARKVIELDVGVRLIYHGTLKMRRIFFIFFLLLNVFTHDIQLFCL